jgi:hypothetical protein
LYCRPEIYPQFPDRQLLKKMAEHGRAGPLNSSPCGDPETLIPGQPPARGDENQRKQRESPAFRQEMPVLAYCRLAWCARRAGGHDQT